MDARPDGTEQTLELLQRAGGGDRTRLEPLLSVHRTRLRRLVELRLDDRLRTRGDASDVVHEALLEAWRRLPEFLEKRPMPLFSWLRFLTKQHIVALHRHHVRVPKASSPTWIVRLSP